MATLNVTVLTKPRLEELGGPTANLEKWSLFKVRRCALSSHFVGDITFVLRFVLLFFAFLIMSIQFGSDIACEE